MRKPRLSEASGAFRYPAFRRVWVTGVLIALAAWTERLAAGWLILTETDSVFLTAVSFAVRQAPGLIAAPIAGALSDRMPRSRLLGLAAAFRAVLLALLALFALSGLEPLWVAFVLIALAGVAHSFETPCTQALVTDSVPRRAAMNAVALQSVGARGVGALGGLLGGVVIASYGIPAALFAGAAVSLAGGLVVATMRPPAARSARPGRRDTSVLSDVADGLRVMFSVPLVRTLLLLAVLVEMFGFAYHSVLPAVARNVLEVGEVGLGVLTMMAGFGSLAGVLALTAIGNVGRRGLLLIGITLGYGAFLVSFASSGLFPLSLALNHRRGRDGGCLRRDAVDPAATVRARPHARPRHRRLGVRHRLRMGRLPDPRCRRRIRRRAVGPGRHGNAGSADRPRRRRRCPQAARGVTERAGNCTGYGECSDSHAA